MNLSQEYLRSLYDYDPETGLFILRIGRGGEWAGTIAGSLSAKGYIQIKINRKSYRAHRLAFLYMSGIFVPTDMEVDHIDGDRSNNRFANLRICTRRENARNMKKPKTNTSGFKGVCSNNGKWEARIKQNYSNIYLGTFMSKEEAASAYDSAALKYHRDFARINSVI